MEEKEKGDEEEGVQSNLSSWWGSFYDTAKQKLTETNEFLVRDIKEFTDTVKSDTSKLVANTAASMKDQLNINVNLDEASNATKVVTNSISGFLGKVVQHVAPIPPDNEEDEDSTMYLGTSAGVKVMSPAEARLFSMQTSPATYCNEPDNSADFEMWKESFVLDDKKEELSLLMLDFREVRLLYTKLVPEAVSHIEFWTRYFYKKDQLEKAEERRARLVERARTDDTELGWGDEDDFDVVDHPLPSEAEPVTVTPSDEPLKKSPISSDSSLENYPIPSDEPLKKNPISSDSSLENCPTPSSDESLKNVSSDPAECVDSFKAASASQDKIASNQSTCIDNNDKLDCDATVESQADRVEDSSARVTNVANDRLSSSPSPELVPSPVEKRSPKLPSNKQSLAEAGQNPSSVKELSSGADSSDWEKEFDLDMTEDEINEVLLDGADETGIEGWEEWE